MHLKHTIRTAFRSLFAHKGRSLLTILGIVIGVTAIIVVMALGQGTQDLIIGEINQLGSDSVVVVAGSEEERMTGIIPKTLRERELQAILNPANVPDLKMAIPMVNFSGRVSYQGTTFNGTGIGTEAEFFAEIFNAYPDKGRLFTKEEIDSRARVVVLGLKAKEELFGSSEAVGEMIEVGGTKFRVVGVFPAIGQKIFLNVDNLILIPYTTAQTFILGTNHFVQIMVKASSADKVEVVKHDINETLLSLHRIDDIKDADFEVQTQQALVDQIGTIMSILTAFLSSMVAVSLVVGGIGIMNIMLVSVTERTKEIGLRKALGATRGDILKQFLIEAVTLTVAGGLVGILLGTLISWVVTLILQATVAPSWAFAFPMDAAILGVLVSAVVGLIFGIYPANQAAKRSPIEALRYE